MTRDRWEKLKQIFGDALDRDTAERDEFVREAVQGDAELLSELLRMLEESDRESGLLSRPALAGARPLKHEEQPRFAPDTTLARRFRIVRFIARGGMGEVYEAEDLELGGRVALKAIRQRMAPNADVLALFKREVQLARRVTHPNVCRIFDLAQHEDPDNGGTTTLLSMELIEGETLSEHLRHNGALGWRDAMPLIEQIAAGLQAVHDAGIIHGDLKPGNVMLASRPGETQPRAIVMDFGMALPAIPESPDDGVIRGGTPEYVAPEQVQGAPVTTATDVYSFALVIGEMLGVPRPSRLQADAARMPSRWARVLRRCVESDPERRYSRPAEIVSVLRGSMDAPTRTARWIGAGAILAVAAGAIAFFIASGPEPSHTTGTRQLFTEDDVLSVWSSSPDGRFLAATSFETDDLVLREIGTGKVRRVTHNAAAPANRTGSPWEARFSPDGHRIAYRWSGKTGSEVRVIGVDGSGEHTVFKDSNVTANAIDWSPDSKRILLSLRSRLNAYAPEEFAVVSAEDGSVLFKKHTDGIRLGRMLFAPDGAGLVFDIRRNEKENGFEIHRQWFNGTESTLIQHPGNDSVIAWSPDRRRLIFSSDRTGQPGIWNVPISNRGAEGEPQELLPDAGKIQPLGVSNTGSLFYRRESDSNDVYTAVLDLAAGRTVSPPERVMNQFIGSYNYPDWSDDGLQLVFGSNHDPAKPALAVYTPKTGKTRELHANLARLWRPQWYVHGSAIMVLGAASDGHVGQYRINPASGEATLFMTSQDLESTQEGVWTPDGKTQFNRYTDGKRGIFRLDVDTGRRQTLYVPPPGVDILSENLALSPDGRTLAFHARNSAEGSGTLMLLPTTEGQAQPLLTIRRPESFLYGAFTWTPDSRSLLVARTRNNRSSEIWRVPVDGGAPSKIDFPAMRITSLRLNPDGKTIAFYCWKWRSEIWVLENFLR